MKSGLYGLGFLPGGVQLLSGRYFMGVCYLIAGLLAYVLFFPAGIALHIYSILQGK